MNRFSFEKLLGERGGAVVITGAIIILLLLVPAFLWINANRPVNSIFTPATATTETTLPVSTALPISTPTPLPPTPTPALPSRTARLNPEHGIHAPIGYQWTDPLRQSLAGFKDRDGQTGAPGLVVALSSDMKANNNQAKARLEEDLHQYERQGAEIYIRMYPQRFPGGLSEGPHSIDNPNTISGTAEDAAEDIFSFVQAQQQRNGWHFQRIIPGNEPDLEWPNDLYYQNLLPWRSNGDPAKYSVMNRFYLELYRAWQRRILQPDATAFKDVVLYFPPLSQDATPGSDFYASFNYYDNQRPVGNRYDPLREAIMLYGRFSWHNYFQPGRACRDVAAAAFPSWLKAGLESGWPALIGEAGWAPTSLALPSQNDSRARLVRFWQLLGVKWEERLYTDDRPQWHTQDETLEGARFEEDLRQFTGGCYKGNLRLEQPVGIAVWLAGSEGNFTAAIGVEPGGSGSIRRWLQQYSQMEF